MPRSHDKERRGLEKPVLLSLSVLILLTGFWLFSKNISSFAQGFFAGETVEPVAMFEAQNSPSDHVEKLEDETPLYAEIPKMGETMGSLYIPKLEAQLPIYHGTDEDELEKGVGHFKESVLPGEKDNSVLSGHRDTVFRNLGKVGEGDELQVTTSAGTFIYKVNNVRIVDKDDLTVIVPKPRAVLTVSTCYPFNFIGAAPKRYILEAFLVSSYLAEK
ncbi:class D sortase [Paenisporosarcina indica]|uniref:class D sortase n=1 Tax=Paenisporosarcina indica TaxID=650093 RepID=UPI00094FB02D|nr:class D sortase [Paenisporosarcina indica]